jgi:hypothetical protein
MVCAAALTALNLAGVSMANMSVCICSVTPGSRSSLDLIQLFDSA